MSSFSSSSHSKQQRQEQESHQTHNRQTIRYSSLQVDSKSSTNLRLSSSPSLVRLHKARWILYISHTVSQLSDVTWQFSITIFMSVYTNFTSLFFVSSYGIASGLLVLICNTCVLGNFIDSIHYTRSVIMQRLLIGQITCTLVTTIMCYSLFIRLSNLKEITDNAIQNQGNDDKVNTSEYYKQQKHEDHSLLIFWTDTYCCLMMIGLHIFGGLGKAIDKAVTIALEKDWVVVISEELDNRIKEKENCHDLKEINSLSPNGFDIDSNVNDTNKPKDTMNAMGHYKNYNATSEESNDLQTGPYTQPLHRNPHSSLTQLNVTMKQIALTCNCIIPVICGFILDSLGDDLHSMSFAALFVGMVEVSSITLKYSSTQQIYYLIPSLEEKRSNLKSSTDEEEKCLSLNNHSSYCNERLYSNMKIYWSQPIHLGGLSLAFLYLNVLTFGNLMTAYLVEKGMSLGTVGIWKGVSATIGLLGTIVYPIFVSSFGLITTGLWGVLIQFGFLTISFISLFMTSSIPSEHSSAPMNQLSIMMLVLGVCASRIGLYVFDITMNQLIQLNTDADVRGVVGAVQESLNAFFDIQSYVCGVFFSDINEFQYLVAIGYSFVGLSTILYVIGFADKIFKRIFTEKTNFSEDLAVP